MVEAHLAKEHEVAILARGASTGSGEEACKAVPEGCGLDVVLTVDVGFHESRKRRPVELQLAQPRLAF